MLHENEQVKQERGRREIKKIRDPTQEGGKGKSEGEAEGNPTVVGIKKSRKEFFLIVMEEQSCQRNLQETN